MDLLSLSDEMLTLVLERTKYGRLMKLRKISRRIDALTRRYKICERVPVDKFNYCDHLGYNQYSVLLYLAYNDATDLSLNSPLTLPATSDLAATIQQYLPLIEVGQDFRIGAIDIKEDEIAILYEQRKSLRKIDKLEIHRTFSIDTSEKYAKMLYDEILPNIKKLNIHQCNDYQLIFNEKLLCNRKWKRIEFNCQDPEVHLNDEFFRKVAINCEEIELVSESRNFTVAGIVELLRNCISVDGKFNRKFDLGLILRREAAIPNIKNILNPIDFPGIMLTIAAPVEHEWYDEEVSLCKITFENHLDAPYLQLWLEENPRD